MTLKTSRSTLLPRADGTTWYIALSCAVLLGNVWNIWSHAPVEVTLLYAAFSSVFAMLAGISAALLGLVRS